MVESHAIRKLKLSIKGSVTSEEEERRHYLSLGYKEKHYVDKDGEKYSAYIFDSDKLKPKIRTYQPTPEPKQNEVTL